jgi:ammonium transporter, Amt family
MLNGADTVFVLISAALVLIMTPGLGFLYGGMVSPKNVVNTLMLSFIAMAGITLQWVLVGYSLAFAPGMPWAPSLLGGLKFIGLQNVGLVPDPTYAATVPHLAFMAFQMMFAIITPALLSGAIVERVRFLPFVAFMGLWSTFIYDTVAHWVWAPDGWIRALGALDFAGGTVVHITAGISGLVAAAVLGPRTHFMKNSDQTPHNAPFVILGAALLWFGWFGFNAGSALAVNGVATLAFVTTHISAAAGTFTWMLLERMRQNHLTVIGAVSGMVAGLVGITPAAGYVSPFAAVAIGILSAGGCYGASLLKNKFRVDDTLDAFTLHGAGGIIGAVLTGVFASKSLNPAGADGLLAGNPKLVLVQLLACGATIIFSAIGTWVLLKGIMLLKTLRVNPEVEALGLDLHHHATPGYILE